MPANVETMFSVRRVPWHGLGTIVENAVSSKEAIELAGLNWIVESNPIFDMNGKVIEGYKANTRDIDKLVLGLVTDKYQIVQNSEAFDFADILLGEGVTYETAGSLKNGRVIWLLAKMPDRYILGDKFDPYMCFCNSHDGTGAIKICMTPIRVECNNTLNLAFQKTTRSWSTKHMGDIKTKMSEARHTLQLANDYLDTLAINADILANEKMTTNEMMDILDEMFPVSEEMSERKKNNIKEVKDDIMVCVFAPDLAKFANTKWAFVNGVSDFVGHAAPARLTNTYAENNWNRIMNGHPILDKAMELVGVNI